LARHNDRIGNPAMRNNKFWLCLPPLFFCLLDQALTLWNQSGAFWNGEYVLAIETNPIAYRLLSQHPALYLAGLVVWITLFLVLIISLSSRLAMILCVAITYGHLWGTMGWLVVPCAVTGCYSFAYTFSLALIIVSAILLVLAWEKSAQAS